MHKEIIDCLTGRWSVCSFIHSRTAPVLKFTNFINLFPAYYYHFFFLSLTLAGSVLIFVTKKANSEELAGKLKGQDFEGIVL